MGTYSKGYGKNFRIVYTVEMDSASRHRYQQTGTGTDAAAAACRAVLCMLPNISLELACLRKCLHVQRCIYTPLIRLFRHATVSVKKS